MATDDAPTTERNDRALANALLGGGLRQGELLDAPHRIDRYELGERIGQGATSEVFRARDTALDRVVAIKLLRGLHEDPIRFKREMQILGALQHPNIVRIFDGGTLGARPYYAMELIEGQPLNQAGLEREAAVEAVEQAALACHSAHQQDIIHRDLKPANILLAADGRAVVADFGVAKVLGSTRTQHTEPGSILGTPRYMAPEQWDGETVDPRTDVYALGVILFELLTGAPPFTGKTLSELGAQVVNKPPRTLRSIDPTIPERLERIVLTALAKRPDDRQPTALVLAKQLSAWRRGEEPEAETLLATMPALDAPSSSGTLAVAAAGLLLLGLLAGGLALGSRSTTSRDVAVETPTTLPSPEATASPQPPPTGSLPDADPTPAFLDVFRASLTDWERAPVDLRRGLDQSVVLRTLRGLSATLTTRRMPAAERRQTQFVRAQALRIIDRDPVPALDGALLASATEHTAEAHLLRAWARFEVWFQRELSGVPSPDGPEDGGDEGDHESDDPGERALADLRDALKHGFARSWRRHLAAALFDAIRGEHAKVAPALERLSKARPDLPPAELDLLRGQLALLRDEPEVAVVHLQRATSAQGTALRARRALALALLERDRPASAFVALAEALRLDPKGRRTLPVYAAFLRGTRLGDLAPDVPEAELRATIELLQGHVTDRPGLPLLQALGSSRVLRALGSLERGEVNADELRAGIRLLQQALKQAPKAPLTLLSLSYANSVAAQHLQPAGPFRRAAWTGLQRLQRLGADVATHDEVEALGDRFAQEIPRARPEGDDR